MRRTLAASLFLSCIAAALPLPGAPAPAKKSIACDDGGLYIGNIIDAKFSLHIRDGKKQTWEYSFIDTHSGTMPPSKIEASGTYELVDDLAIFTGTLKGAEADKDKETEVRFGLNYGFPDGKVLFNRFFPAPDKTQRYHRKLFEKRDGQWRVREERILSMPAAGPPDKGKWQVKFTGERVRRDKAGKEVRQKVEEQVAYDKGEHGVWILARPVSWLPGTLVPQKKDGEILSVGGDVSYDYLAALRGFHPFIANLPVPD
jgi:hypothetical protein